MLLKSNFFALRAGIEIEIEIVIEIGISSRQ